MKTIKSIKSPRTFVMGDIHGAYKALVQCLAKCNFDKEIDTLIQLGDICDGYDEVFECVKELLSIKNLIAIKGNHDNWFLQWLNAGVHPVKWEHGGYGTLKSYCEHERKFFFIHNGVQTDLNPFHIPESHVDLFRFRQHLYYKDEENNRLFIHGGFNRHFSLKEQPSHIFYWDRDLWAAARNFESMGEFAKKNYKFKVKDKFSEIFIGHTSTINYDTMLPMKAANIYNIDTGAGFNGKLTIMDVNTKEYWQSDNVRELYKDQLGRNSEE